MSWYLGSTLIVDVLADSAAAVTSDAGADKAEYGFVFAATTAILGAFVVDSELAMASPACRPAIWQGFPLGQFILAIGITTKTWATTRWR